MNKFDQENISALVDGYWADTDGNSDSSDAEAALDHHLDSLQYDEQARDRWTRYHLIRDALQETAASPLDAGFADRVSAAIQAEPAIVALPSTARDSARRASREDAQVENGQVEEGQGSATGQSSGRVVQGNFKRNLVGLSVAATVAMVSLLGLNLLQSSRDTAPASSVAVLPSSTSGQLQFVSNPVGSYWVGHERTLSPESEQRLNMYLSQHIEHSPTADVTGMLPYSRLAGYDAPGVRNANTRPADSQ